MPLQSSPLTQWLGTPQRVLVQGYAASPAGLVYRVYANSGDGGPVDYDTPVATVGGHDYEVPTPLSPGTWRFAVRAFDTATGLEDLNVDAAVEVVIAADGSDVTARPDAPTALRAVPQAGGVIQLEWSAPVVRAGHAPTGFRVYGDGGTGTVDYGTVLATVASPGLLGTYRATLTGLTPGVTHRIGVRAYNASGEEDNAATVAATPDATGPDAVDGLTATAVSEGT